MRKLFNLRVEVVTGIVAAAVLIGLLAVSGVPSIGVAQGATNVKAGFKALSASVIGEKKAESKEDLFGGCERQANQLKAAATTPDCDGDKKDCDKKAASATCPMGGLKADKALGGCCPKSQPADVPAATKDGPEPKLAKAE